MRHYDTNLHDYDVLAVKSCLLMFIYSQSLPKQVTQLLQPLFHQLAEELAHLPIFIDKLRTLSAAGKTKFKRLTESTANFVQMLTKDFHLFEQNAERILQPVIPQRVNRYVL